MGTNIWDVLDDITLVSENGGFTPLFMVLFVGQIRFGWVFTFSESIIQLVGWAE